METLAKNGADGHKARLLGAETLVKRLTAPEQKPKDFFLVIHAIRIDV